MWSKDEHEREEGWSEGRHSLYQCLLLQDVIRRDFGLCSLKRGLVREEERMSV